MLVQDPQTPSSNESKAHLLSDFFVKLDLKFFWERSNQGSVLVALACLCTAVLVLLLVYGVPSVWAQENKAAGFV